jgi:hypothetical protein
MSNFTKSESNDETVLLCKVHYFQRFREGGSYLGGDKFRVKADRDVRDSSNTTPVPASESNSPVPSSTTPANDTVFALPKAVVEEKKTVADEAAPVHTEAPAVEGPVAETEIAEAPAASEETVVEAEPVAEAATAEADAEGRSTPDNEEVEPEVQDSAEKLTLEEIPASDD